jgi:hypothetical protein
MNIPFFSSEVSRNGHTDAYSSLSKLMSIVNSIGLVLKPCLAYFQNIQNLLKNLYYWALIMRGTMTLLYVTAKGDVINITICSVYVK